jgi:hypothetical protein
MATLYKTDGTVEEVKPKTGKYFSYEELQAFVGKDDDKMIEIVPLPSGKSMIVNEEGKLIGLKKNYKATEHWQIEYPIEDYPGNNDELIVGNALVVEDSELE